MVKLVWYCWVTLISLTTIKKQAIFVSMEQEKLSTISRVILVLIIMVGGTYWGWRSSQESNRRDNLSILASYKNKLSGGGGLPRPTSSVGSNNHDNQDCPDDQKVFLPSVTSGSNQSFICPPKNDEFKLNKLQENTKPTNSCIGPTELVKVKIREQSKNPSIYSYEVTNLHKSPIYIFTLGDSDHFELRPIEDLSIRESPKEWEGHAGVKYESNYQNVSWATLNTQSSIKPHETLRGFSVEVSPFLKEWEGKFDNDGLPVVPLNMKQVPFLVYFNGDNVCLWGRPVEN